MLRAVNRFSFFLLVVALLLPFGQLHAEPDDGFSLYISQCAGCHGTDRLGGVGPGLFPAMLGRIPRARAASIIAEGLPATKMPGFKAALDAEQIASIVEVIYAPLPVIPQWGTADIAMSHKRFAPQKTKGLPRGTDPWNLFVVVETGDNHISILDGDKLAVVDRVPTRRAVHGGVKFSPDGRFAYWISRDGWVAAYDLKRLALVAEIRVAIGSRNLAISPDGSLLFAANLLPGSIVILDAATLELRQQILTGSASDDGKLSAVYQAAPRQSVLAAFKGRSEVWEFPVQKPPAGRGYAMFVTNAASEELRRSAAGIRTVLRYPTPFPFTDFFFTPDYRFVLGASRGFPDVVVYDMNTQATVARLQIPGLPHLGSGITWYQGDDLYLATQNIKAPQLSIIRVGDWQLEHLETGAPGFFLRSHKDVPTAWADGMMSKSNDTILVFDKHKRTIVKKLVPQPGQPASHVEFDRHGRYALVSLNTADGALVVYDAKSFAEVRRIPMKKPSGKYNVYNKVHRDEGTSH